jgi:type IV fimbrial biogenesis protein FimT
MPCDLHGKSCRSEHLVFNPHVQMSGHTLLELMICISIVGLITGFASHQLSQQMAQLQLERVAHAFIQDAQLARQLSRQLGQSVTMKPLRSDYPQEWGHGWVIQGNGVGGIGGISGISWISGTNNKHGATLLKQYSLTDSSHKIFVGVANDLLKDSQQFADISAPGKARHLTFKDGQMALLNNGGFVANRIIWQHQNYPNLLMHVILGPGGRWRSCNPNRDTQKCQ